MRLSSPSLDQRDDKEKTDCDKLVDDMVALTAMNDDGGLFESTDLGSDIMDRYTNPGSHGRFFLGNWFGEEPSPYRLEGTTGFRPLLSQGGQGTDLLLHVAAGASSSLHRIGEGMAFVGSMYDTLQWIDSFGARPDIPGVTAGKNLDGLETAAEIAGNYSGMFSGRHMRKFLQGKLNENQLREALTRELCE